jgi:hypothetical protein
VARRDAIDDAVGAQPCEERAPGVSPFLLGVPIGEIDGFTVQRKTVGDCEITDKLFVRIRLWAAKPVIQVDDMQAGDQAAQHIEQDDGINSAGNGDTEALSGPDHPISLHRGAHLVQHASMLLKGY